MELNLILYVTLLRKERCHYLMSNHRYGISVNAKLFAIFFRLFTSFYLRVADSVLSKYDHAGLYYYPLFNFANETYKFKHTKDILYQ